MTKRILIDAVHPEEVRVAVADEQKLIEFDFESTAKKQIKSNIYLGKITRVEPSLQAAFVEYGGNRQGFLPFSEIHFDYYQIPVEDKKKLKAMLEADSKKEEEEIDKMEAEEAEKEAKRNASKKEGSEEYSSEEDKSDIYSEETDKPKTKKVKAKATKTKKTTKAENKQDVAKVEVKAEDDNSSKPKYEKRGKGNKFSKNSDRRNNRIEIPEPFTKKDLYSLIKAEQVAREWALELMGEDYVKEYFDKKPKKSEPIKAEKKAKELTIDREDNQVAATMAELEPEDDLIDNILQDDESTDIDLDTEIVKNPTDFYKQYKIQEVIKRNQVVLVQVVKEERGNKGASLTTYLAIAGRFCVFMPNTEKGGGVSRRISNFSERRRIRQVVKTMDVPSGTSVIVRTAGMEKDEDEIRGDFAYLKETWNEIREQTLESKAPAVVYEESDIIRRTIRDLFKGDVEEVVIEGEEAYKNATRFVEIASPEQVANIKKHVGTPIFHKYKIEEKLDALHDPNVKLDSGGSIVITPTEALVAVDVNSGKATKERSVEDTAVNTNLEAARELARQLRLRDLAGLIVIDFIDMRELKNRKAVEKELKDSLRSDRAKIQIGRISTFGLLEMSRQRMHSSLMESVSDSCDMCKGTGYTRSQQSLSMKAVRNASAEAVKKTVKEIRIYASSEISDEIRSELMEEIKAIEDEHEVKILVEEDNQMYPNQFEITTNRNKKRSLGKFSGRSYKKKPNKAKNYDKPADSNSKSNKIDKNEGYDNSVDKGNEEVSDNLNDGNLKQSSKPKNPAGKPIKKKGKNENFKSGLESKKNDGIYNEENNFEPKPVVDNGEEDKSSKLLGLWKKITK